MADFIFNRALGRHVELYNRVKSNDPANSAFIIVLLKLAEADSVLRDYDDLGALLGAAGNTEADFTNYARITLTDAQLASLPAPDDTANTITVDFPDQNYVAAGGTVNNSLVKVLFCYDSDTTTGTDTNILPVYCCDYVRTTTGSDLPLTINSTGIGRTTAA